MPRFWGLLVLGAALLSACGAPRQPAIAPPLPTARVAMRPTLEQQVRPYTPTPTALVLLPAATATPEAATATPTSIPLEAPSAPSPAATTAPTSDPAELEALLIVAINQVRAANQLPPYRPSPELSAAARAHSCDLAAHGLISHTSSDGRTLTDRLAGADPPWQWPSESIAAGTNDPNLVVAMWMDEPPEGWHRRNILDTDQREVGAGYCFASEDASGNHHYWTADFSRRGDG